jgi:hypothetical protein
MKILSDFHDYYDRPMAHDADRETLWIRKTNDKDIPFTLQDVKEKILNHVPSMLFDLNLRPFIILFAGKVYPALEVSWHAYDYSRKEVCYSIDKVDDLIVPRLTESGRERYLGNHHKRRSRFRGGSRDNLEAFFALAKDQRLFVINDKHRTPVAMISYSDPCWVIKLNCQLKTYQFMKVVDVFTAYQEISMFVNNMAVPEKVIIEPNDTLKVETHGFNKYSFRKDPSKKKR